MWWDRQWQYWCFIDQNLRGWAWEIQYDCVTPMVKYFEKPSGHIVTQMASKRKPDDPKTEEDIYFENQSKKVLDGICGF